LLAVARAQAMVEFAVVAGLLFFVLLMAIQVAIIGNAALAVNQYAYSVARYASVTYYDSKLSSPNSDPSVQALVPPTIAGNDSSGNPLATVTLTQCAAQPNTFGSTASVTVSYNLSTGNKIFLPNPFKMLSSGVSIPTTLSSKQAAFCE
jgi:Flp pilus assembly protein TadG